MEDGAVVVALEAELDEVAGRLRGLLEPELDVQGAHRRPHHHLPPSSAALTRTPTTCYSSSSLLLRLLCSPLIPALGRRRSTPDSGRTFTSDSQIGKPVGFGSDITR